MIDDFNIRKNEFLISLYDGFDLSRNAAEYVMGCMREVPAWAYELPVDCEVEIGKSYGDCEKFNVEE